MNKTTVYRILNKLEDDGLLHSFLGKNGHKWYAKCDNCSPTIHHDIHPHFQCKKCGEIRCLSVSFNIPSVDGYKVDSVNLLMVGECYNCS